MDCDKRKQEKKRYWLKLDKDFLRSPQMKVLKNTTNGKDYIIFYLSLMLESVETVGHLRFTSLVPYNDEMLSAITDTNIDIVRSAVKLFCELGLMQIFDDGTIFMPQVPKMTGKESESAERVRNYRERLKKQEDTKLLQCNEEVTKCNDNKEKDKQEYKEKYKQEYKEKYKEEQQKLLVDGENDNKQKQVLLEHFEKIWKEYPNKKGKAKAEQYFIKFITVGRKINGKNIKLNDVQIWNAVCKYKNECKKNRVEQQYIKHGDTFFNSAILDYIEVKKEEEKQEYKEVNMTEEEYIKKLDNGGKKYV